MSPPGIIAAVVLRSCSTSSAIGLAPTPENGLRAPSQVMIDKAMTVRAERIGAPFGRLDDAAMVSVNRLLALFLGVAG